MQNAMINALIVQNQTNVKFVLMDIQSLPKKMVVLNALNAIAIVHYALQVTQNNQDYGSMSK